MVGAGYSDVDETRDTAVTHWIMAVGLAVATGFIASYLPWPWVFDMDSPDFNPMVALPLLLGGTAVWKLVGAITWTVRYRRFGTTTMELKGPVPAKLGARLEGIIRTPRPLVPQGPVRIALQCVDTHDFRDLSSGATRTNTAESFVIWEREIEVPTEALDATRGIPFAFELPGSVGPRPTTVLARRSASGITFEFKAAIMIPGLRQVWTRNAPPVARRWLLKASAPMPGADFHARFAVPVEEG